MALGAPSLGDVHGFGGADLTGQLDDAFGRDTGDGRGPLRCFGYAVRAAAQDVVLVAVVGWYAGGHGQRIKSQTVAVQKGLIHPPLGDQYMGDAAHQGRV